MANVHTPLEAAIVVSGGIALLSGPMLWWVFFRMDENKNHDDPVEDGDCAPMTEEQINNVENTLSVSLPSSLKGFLKTKRDADLIDFMTVFGSAENIIETTAQFRAGLGRIPKWPSNWVAIGDDGSGCPHVIDCRTSAVFCLDHGDSRHNLRNWESFQDFVAHEERTSREVIAELANDPPLDPDSGIPKWMYGPWGIAAITSILLTIAAIIVLVAWLAGGLTES